MGSCIDETQTVIGVAPVFQNTQSHWTGLDASTLRAVNDINCHASSPRSVVEKSQWMTTLWTGVMRGSTPGGRLGRMLDSNQVE